MNTLQAIDPADTLQAGAPAVSAPEASIPEASVPEANTSEVGAPEGSPAANDTLQADLQPYPHWCYGNADSLRVHLQMLRQQQPKPQTDAADIFGPAATLAPAPHPVAGSRSLTDNALFQGCVLLLAAAYILLLHHNLPEIRVLFARISRRGTSGKRISEESAGSTSTRLSPLSTLLGALFVGIFLVKGADLLLPEERIAALPRTAVPLLCLLASALGLAVLLYQQTLLRLTGALTLTTPFIRQLEQVRQTCFSIAVLLLSPLLLLFALCPRNTGGVWFVLIVMLLTGTLCLYLKETLSLFISKKISILHWFLYLCSVEIFPVSLLVLLATR